MNKEQGMVLLDNVARAVKGIAPSEHIDLKTHDAIALGLFMRTIGLFDGVRTLLRDDLGVESMILARSLFADCLQLIELSKANQPRRIGLLIGWKLNELKQQRHLYNQAVDCELESDASEIRILIDRRREQAKEYAHKHSTTPEYFSGTCDLATKHNLTGEYWCYVLGNHMVHASDVPLSANRVVDPQFVKICLRNNDPSRLAGYGAFAAKSTLLAGRATSIMYGWMLPESFDSLMAQVQSILDDNPSLAEDC